MYPGSNLIGEIALTIKNNRLSLLPVNMTGDNTPPDKIHKVKPFTTCVPGDIDNITTGIPECLQEKFIVGSFGKIDHTILSSCCLCNLGMYFFCSSDMIKRKKEKDPVLLFQRPDQGNQPSYQYKRKNKHSLQLSFQDQVLI